MLKRWMAIGMLVCMTVGILQVPGSQVEAEENTTPSLKAAILSDVHLGYNYGDLASEWEQKDWFKYILQWYKKEDVDAVIIPGDLVDGPDETDETATEDEKIATAETQFEEFFDVWNSVFTAKKGEEGYVEPIFIYGNHDKRLSQNEATGDYWNKYLGEAFSPVYSKEVGGYWFVCAHESLEKANKDELKKQIEEAVGKSNGKPVFYLQHAAIYQTTGGSDGLSYGDVTTGFDVIKDYENVVALTGHTHRSITNDASIWQGDDWNEGQFTTITCSTLAYGSFEDKDYTGNNLDPKVDSVKTKQGLIMNASGNDINVKRYSFYTDEMVGLVEGTDTTQDYDNCVKSAGADWNFTVGGEKPYTFDKCYEESIVPEFPENAKANDDLLETGSVGYSFFNNGDTVYTQQYGLCEKDGRNVLKVTRAANVTTEYPYTYPVIHITLPKDVSLTEDTYISLDAWFNEYAHPWTTIILYNDAWGTVGSISKDYKNGIKAWETFGVQVKDMNSLGDLSTVTKIAIQINVAKNAEYDTEFYFDNLKLLNTHAECSDTSASVTFPSASMSDGGMFKDYVVEAKDVNSGVIKATATVNTEYRIDTDIESRYKDSYSVDVTGLLEDTAYDFYIYGRNFYGKCSTEPLVITAKTTGTRTSNGDEKGDVNNDFYTDVRDLVALKANGATAVNKDVDENGTVDAEADKNGLLRILLGYTSVVQDSEKDLIGQSTYQSGTLLAGKKGYGIQTAVVNNATENFTDSKAAYEVWATADGIGTSWGLGTNIYFDEAQDWSGTNTLNFDVLSEDNCATRSYEICLISGEQEVLSNKLWPQAATSTWSTISIPRSSFTNVDWTNVKGIRIYMQFDADSGRYTGVEKSSFFVDNMYASYTLVPDTDLLSHYNTSMVAIGGTLSVVNGATAGNTASEMSCEAHQLQLSGETATLDIPVSGKLSALNTMSIAAKLSKGALSVQPYTADETLVGTAKTLVTSADTWNVHTFAATEFGYADTVKGYRFTVTGAEANATLLLDDFTMTYQKCEEDTDLFATETVTYPGIDNVNSKVEMQPYTTKDSNAAIHIRKDVKENNGWPYVLVEFEKAKDMTNLLNLSLDARFGKNTVDWVGVYLYDENGNASTGNGYNSSKTYDWEKCSISASDINYGVADKTKIKKIKLQLNFDPGTNRSECQNQLFDIWLDNLQLVMKDDDDLLETGSIGYSFFNNGDTVYTQGHGLCTKDGRLALKVTRAANVTTAYPYSYPIAHITLPAGVSITGDTYINLDAWFSEYAHPWTTIILYNDSWGSVGSVGNNYKAGVWDTFRVQAKDILCSGYTVDDLATVTKIGIQINVEKNNQYDTEFYFDNLKLITKDNDDLLETGSVGYSFFNNGDTVYTQGHGLCIKDGRMALKVTRSANVTTEYPYTYPVTHITLPTGVSITEDSYISLDAWFSEHAYPWTTILLYNDSWGTVGSISNNYLNGTGAWETFCVQAKDITYGANYTVDDLSTVTKIAIQINVEKNNQYDTEFYFDSLRVINPDNEDLLESGSIGYSFFNNGDTVYTHGHGLCIKDGRKVLKVTRAANVTTEYPYTYPVTHITLPTGVSITQDTYISLDAWFSEYAHPWTTVILYNDSWGTVGSITNDYLNGTEAWETFCVQAKNITFGAGYTVDDLSTVTKIAIQINVEKNSQYDTEFYFDKLKLFTE